MEFAILGTVEARVNGKALELGGGKQRALLAVLLLHPNEAVSRDRLIDALWGEHPPPSVHQSLDSYVSRLRKALGRDRLIRQSGGYVLVVEPGELDLDRFEALLRAAHGAAAAGDTASAATSLHAALGLWRGAALADVLYEPFASAAAERLEERRLGALEERIDVDLAAGNGGQIVPELEALVREHPLRERLLGQLMTALYRAGRQAEALAALQEARHRLASELGLEPGPQLRELERQILQHDPELDGGPRRAVLTADRSRRSALIAIMAAVAVAAAAIGAIVATGGGDSPSGGSEHESQLVSIDSESNNARESIGLSRAPAGLAAGFGSLWATDPTGQRVIRVDLGSGSPTDRIAVGAQPGSVATGGGAVWVGSTVAGSVSRVDPATGALTQTIRLGGANVSDVEFGDGSVWVADSSDHALIEIEPETGSVRRTVRLDLAPTALAVRAGLIWVAGYERGVLEEVDSRSGEVVDTVAVGQGPSAVAAGSSGIWVANSLDATVSRIDPTTGSVKATIPVPSGPAAVVATKGSIWVASADVGVLSEIDPRRNEIVSSQRVGGRPSALASTEERIWVGTSSLGESHRGGTLTLVRAGRFATIDPGLGFENAAQFLRLAYDTLVTFQAVSGPAGLRLLPDLAVALPRPANGGTSYRFRLRPDIRYSDGRKLRAHDFRRAIERLFRVRSPGASYYTGLVGAPACERNPRRCRLAEGVETDDATQTVVFRLRAPDPDFLYKLTVLAYSTPVPPGIPDRDIGRKAIPGTGPYRFHVVNARGLRFERNPFFREWSHAAQPAGNPDAIVWRYATSQRSALKEVERGRADWLLGLIPAGELRSLQLRHPSQVQVNPTPTVEFIPVNTHRRPFDDVRVRRALNFAIDRAKIANWYGGPLVATPLCQPLAPGLLGYRRYCPYTRDPLSGGRWSSPDLVRAKSLVAASGTLGERVDVWGSSDDLVPPQIPPYIVQVLRSLGYKVQLHLAPLTSITPTMRRTFQLSAEGDWLPDYPAPSAYLPLFFGCDGGHSHGYFCDPRLDRQMRRATTLQLTQPARAAALWATIDRQLTDRAAWVPTVNVRFAEFVSKRLRNYQFSPVGGFLPSQVWLR